MPAPVLATRGRAGSGTVAFLLAAAVLPPYGCSFLAVKPPPEHPAFLERVDCTTSYSAPTADILLGVVQLVVAVGIAGSGSTYVGANQRDLVARTEAILAGAQTGAAIWGFRKVRACNDLMESQRPLQPRGYPRSYVPQSSDSPPLLPPSEAPLAVPKVPPPPAPATAVPVPPAPPVRQQIDNE
jgi:hypothetical protein